MTHGQLFAGIGGFGLAAQWAGIENIWANEIDPFCCKVLRKNFPELKVYEEDIKNIGFVTYTEHHGFNETTEQGGIIESKEKRGKFQSKKGGKKYKHNLEPVDIISGGFPCQPFSHAGKRKGTEDDRHLWPEMLRIIQEVKPSWVIGENVAGLVSMENGKTLDRILADLEDSGHNTETFLIPACGVSAWHRRDRIWIVSNTISRGQPRQGEFKQSINTKKAKEGETNKFINDGGFKQWSTEPNVGRVANGVPRRVDRLKSLGNAIVPQVAYEIFKAINEYDTTHQTTRDRPASRE